MKYFSLFTGVGGFELGIDYATKNRRMENKTGQNVRLECQRFEKGGLRGDCSVLPKSDDRCTDSSSPECVGFSEVDKFASSVLQYQFPNTKNYGDITKINWSDVPDFDLLVGGSPCQSFSIAGKRKGFAGASGLFWEYVSAIREKNLLISSGKMLKECLAQTEGVISQIYSLRFPKRGILSNGRFSTPKTSVSLKTESVSLLSVLEETPNEKYFLSEAMQKTVLREIEKNRGGRVFQEEVQEEKTVEETT